MQPTPPTDGSHGQSVQSVCNQLARNSLALPEEVRAIYRRWLQEAGTASADVAGFVKWLVAKKHLTDYQAAVITGRRKEPLRIGEYKVLLRIGHGPMAGVYQGVHTQGQIVAIKMLPPAKAADPKLLARFQRESRLAMRLQHPNVARTFQAGEEHGLHYLVLEYLEGQTLKDVLLRRGRLSAAEAIRLIYQVLQGLQHIHEVGMVHRDLEPGNLMLVSTAGADVTESILQCTVKILDIGLGRALFDEGTPGVPVVLTTQGEMLGTPDYCAPEQFLSAHTVDIRADIYSVGCVLYHALVGESPFVEKNLVRLQIRHCSETPAPLASFNLQVPAGLQKVMDCMLAKDPALRYATPGEAAKELRAFMA